MLNTLGGPRTAATHYGRAYIKLALQVDLHGEAKIAGIAKKTDPGSYHGAWIDEELASLISVALGVRCRSGGLWRDFQDPDAGRGNPYLGSYEAPRLTPPQGPGWIMLPHLNLEADLSELPQFLDRYALLEAEMAVGLVRAARLFQQAIWIADADANLAWILLVSSLEAAAASWGGGMKEDPLKEIEANWAELGELLAEVADNDPGLAVRLSKLLRGHIKMQRRVKSFVSEYCPVAPEPRPSFDAVDWEPKAIVESLGPIYNWRSRFLHDAIPFPGAMCEPPRKDKAGVFSECPGGLGTGIGDATWLAEDTPMLLWPFAYLVNEVLRSWWLGETRADAQ